MDYEVLESVEDVPVTDLAEYDSIDADNDIRQLDAALALDHLRLKLWYFEPGEAVDYHAHLHQEEVYFALEGTFELELGDPGDTETREVEAGAWWVAKPRVGHGHRYLDDRNLDDRNLDDRNLDDRNLDDRNLDDGRGDDRGDDRGVLLAIGAPAVDDEAVDPTELAD